jgi:PPOX class probable F420-dependent enzyme
MSVLDAGVRALVEGKNLGHLATTLPDGSPHSVPVWIDMEGDRVVFMTDPQSVKGRNIARDPRVALSISDAERPNTMAQIRGRVIQTIDGDAGWTIIDRLCNQYLGMPYPLREGRIAYVIEPQRSFLFAP